MTDDSDGLDLGETDRAIINAFQGGFPVVRHPFEPAAEVLGRRGVDVDAAEIVDRVQRLTDEGYLSRFGVLVDADALGVTTTLVAMHVPEAESGAVADCLDAHREVVRDDEREHPHLNVWFVVSAADESRVAAVLDDIEAETGRETYDIPLKRQFCAETKFLVDGPVSAGDVDLSHLGPSPAPASGDGLTPDERCLVAEIQGGLPVTETPYADVADALDVDPEWVVETIRRFNDEGKIRRLGVVANRGALGYSEHRMTVWDVPEDVVAAVGPEVAGLDFVTHCYERPRHEKVWPYNVFATTHGRTAEESERHVRQVRDVIADHWDVSPDDWDTLASTRTLQRPGDLIDACADLAVDPDPEPDTDPETDTDAEDQ